MKDLLKRIDDAGILLDLVDGKLKLYAEGDQIDPVLLNEIRENKNQIESFLLQNNISALYEYEYASIPRSVEQKSYPLSDAQRRLWVLSQFENESGVYNMPNTILIKGNYDMLNFKKAVMATIHRYEILRTVFKKDEEDERSDDVRQWILDSDALDIQIRDIDFTEDANSTADPRDNDLHDLALTWIKEDATKPFDLENGPLLRAAILKIDADEYLFYCNMHHIISDGWSLQILVNEVFRFYTIFNENRDQNLDELPIQYKDYAEWQLNQINTDQFRTHKEYWINRLSGNLPVIDLPTTKRRPQFKTYHGLALNTFIDSEIKDGLTQRVNEKGGSLFMGLLAAWNIAISHYSGEQDVIVGTPVAGREHADLENQIGFFVNMLPLRNYVDPTETLAQFYEKVKECTLEGLAHQLYPFDRLVDELNLQHRTDRTVVFDLLFSLQNQSSEIGATNKDQLELTSEELDRIVDRGETAPKFDLEVAIQENGKYLEMTVIFNSDVYEKEMVERLIVHFKTILKLLTTEPNALIGEISVLSQNEKQQQQLNFNQTRKQFSPYESLIELFEQKVEENPNYPALIVPSYDHAQLEITDSIQLTFKELDSQSSQFAHFLIEKYELGIGDLVALKLDRDERMIISILAVMKTGAAYLPVDPEYPSERIDFMLNDARCKLIIDSNVLDEFRGNLYPVLTPKRIVKSTDLAYVIYTSGSTGKPKGVMVSHGAVLNTLLAQIDAFGLGNDTIGLQFASFSFDASISEIFITLLSGGTLVVANEFFRSDPELLTKLIHTYQVNLATLPPTYLSKIEASKLAGVKKLISAGEPASYARAIAHLEYGSYFNAYGPTETAICATIFELNKINSLKINHLPIGTAIANTEIYILNQNQEFLPLGAIGEICVGGLGVAMGYVNRPELTAEKFVPHPFHADQRIYRTGDLGRWLADGNIEFLGRKDEQVKIRGYRVELGEVEHALRENDQIKQAVVLAKQNKDAQNELVAYLTAHGEQEVANLRAELKRIVPEYMIPSHFVQLVEFPLTSNGKIDKKSLPNPDGLEISSGTAYVAPRNEIEEKMVEVWQMVLNRKRVGVYDDFHELGGYSVKAIGLVAEYNKTFNVRLTLQEIYQRTKLVEHAELVDIRKWVNETNDQRDDSKENIETFEF